MHDFDGDIEVFRVFNISKCNRNAPILVKMKSESASDDVAFSINDIFHYLITLFLGMISTKLLLELIESVKFMRSLTFWKKVYLPSYPTRSISLSLVFAHACGICEVRSIKNEANFPDKKWA